MSRDRWGRIKGVHYLPEGIRLRAGARHHRPDIVLTDDTSFTNPIELQRDGNRVYVHLPNQVITVEKGGKLNLTNVVVEFVPLVRDGAVDKIFRLESELFNPNLSERVRSFLRLYIAYSGLKHVDRLPESMKDSVLLLSSRMAGIPVEKLVSERKRIEKKLEEDMKEVLASMTPDEVAEAFALIA